MGVGHNLNQRGSSQRVAQAEFRFHQKVTGPALVILWRTAIVLHRCAPILLPFRYYAPISCINCRITKVKQKKAHTEPSRPQKKSTGACYTPKLSLKVRNWIGLVARNLLQNVPMLDDTRPPEPEVVNG